MQGLLDLSQLCFRMSFTVLFATEQCSWQVSVKPNVLTYIPACFLQHLDAFLKGQS